MSVRVSTRLSNLGRGTNQEPEGGCPPASCRPWRVRGPTLSMICSAVAYRRTHSSMNRCPTVSQTRISVDRAQRKKPFLINLGVPSIMQLQMLPCSPKDAARRNAKVMSVNPMTMTRRKIYPMELWTSTRIVWSLFNLSLISCRHKRTPDSRNDCSVDQLYKWLPEWNKISS